MEFVSPICLFTCCRLEYIKLGSPSDLTWSEFPQTLTQMQGARMYVTLFKSPFVDSSLSEKENNALRVSSLLAVPPPPPEVQPLEGLQGTNLPKANLTQWASYVQDVASGMQLISIDKPTTHESFASVSNFSVIYQIYCTNNFTYQSNCYSRSIHCQAIILLIADTYL